MEKEKELEEALTLLEQEKNKTKVLRDQLRKANVTIAGYEEQKAQNATDTMFEQIRKNAQEANEKAVRIERERRAIEKVNAMKREAFLNSLIVALVAALVFSTASAFVILIKPSGLFLYFLLFVVFSGGVLAHKSFSCIQSFFGGFKK